MIFSNNIYHHINHFGLSITPNAVRVISIDKSGKVSQKSEIISQKPLITGDVVDIESLTAALVSVMKQVNGVTVYAAVCFPEKLAYSREHVLPKLPIQEISEAIRWQLPTIFPLNPEDIYYDWKLILQSDQETRVAITAVSRNLLDGVLASCLAAGIKPISFESSAGALARAVKTLPPEAIITEVDNFGSSSTLIKNGVSSLTTTTSFLTSADSQAVLQEIVSSVKHLLSRIQPKATKDIKDAVPLIYITGEKSSSQLTQILSTQIGQPVVELNLGQIPSLYHLAYIESLTRIESPESEKTINLLPEQLQQTYRSEAELAHARKNTLIGTTIGAIACLVAIGVFVAISIISQQSISKAASIAPPPDSPADINLPQIMQKAQKISSLQSAKKMPIESLVEAISITQPLPIRQFDYSASTKSLKISLSGVGRSTLFDIKDLFEATGKFQPVTIPLSALGSEESEAISLTIQIKEK